MKKFVVTLQRPHPTMPQLAFQRDVMVTADTRDQALDRGKLRCNDNERPICAVETARRKGWSASRELWA